MSGSSQSFFDCDQYSLDEIQSLFSLAKQLRDVDFDVSRMPFNPESLRGKTAVLTFFEPSTRTRLSFQMAAYHLQMNVLSFAGESSSLSKGESELDTIRNLDALGPALLVLRCNDDFDQMRASYEVNAPVLNAGWGQRSHPTQALLDAFTMQDVLGDLNGKRVLFIGDIKHSRVARSNIALLQRLGVQVMTCAPEDYQLEADGVEAVASLDQAIPQADAIVALRVQNERHSEAEGFSVESFQKDYRLSSDRLTGMKPNAIIMHPGPINHGVEMTEDVLRHPRCMVLNQVKNGVAIRAALIVKVLLSTEGSP